MATIFDKAKASSSKKQVEKHEVVNILRLEKNLSRVFELNAKIAELEAEKTMLSSELYEAGKKSMVKLYNERKSFPGTLKIKAGQMNFQFITSDRYKQIDEDRYNELSKTYGANIVEENTVFSFNTAILMKHQKHISELLQNSKILSDEEKDNLLDSATSYNVKKETIGKLFSFKKVKNDVETIVEDIQPVFSIKSIKKD